MNPRHYVNERTFASQPSPTIRLAAISDSMRLSQPVEAAALLVSYYYIAQFRKDRDHYLFRDWSMDSGAFSAENSGKKIDLAAYMDECLRLLATDPKLTEVFSLDDISDWRKSDQNTRAMWRAGIPAIPTFHWGEPWDVLIGMARDYPKISIGGVVGKTKAIKDRWVGQVFARVWPKKIHGLGMTAEDLVMKYPFHSVDASSWEFGPRQYGRWQSFRGKLTGAPGWKMSLRSEIEWYMALEKRARARWKRTWEAL